MDRVNRVCLQVSRACQLLAQQVKTFFKNPSVLIWIILAVILFPIIKPGFFSVHDETHIVDVYQMIRSLEVGGFPPRFIPDVNFGIGHPYFNFYYHLPFYITSLLYFAGFSMVSSFKYMMGIAVIAAGWGFYFFLRNHVEKKAATIGALVYILSPYFAVDLFVRGAFGELFIFALLPWSAYFLNNYLKSQNPRNLAFSSLMVGLILLSHNVLLPFVLPVLFMYGLIILGTHKSKPVEYFKLFAPFLLGLGLGSYYLLPAFFEIIYISSYEQFNIVDHFPFIKQLIIPYWGYGVSIWGDLDDISFNIGTVNLIVVVLSIMLFKSAKREYKILLGFFLGIFALAVILMNVRTLAFWQSINFLRLVQFPWRMLIFTTVSSAFISAVVSHIVFEKYSKRAAGFFFAVVLGLLIVLNIWHYGPSEYKQVTDEDYLERYFANRTLQGDGTRGYLSPEYLNFTEDFIPPTIWEKKRPDRILDTVSLATPSGQIEYFEEGLKLNISYETTSDNEIIVAKAFFPGWKASSEGKEIKIEPYSDYGIIGIPVTEGKGDLSVEFADTPIRTIGNIVSVVAAGFILVLLVYPVFRKARL